MSNLTRLERKRESRYRRQNEIKTAWTIEKYNLFGNKWHAMPSSVHTRRADDDLLMIAHDKCVSSMDGLSNKKSRKLRV